MRLHLLIPIAFLCGIEGLIIFVPYLLMVIAVWHISRSRRISAKIQAATIAVAATEPYPAVALATA